jgi:hypothetical protein
MHTLSDGELTVELLDPATDLDRLGARYCTAGYIFQVHHAQHGPLLSGPRYPDEFHWYDGQGAPDTFHRAPVRSEDTPDRVLIPGVGICSSDQKQVIEFARWNQKKERNTVHWNTEHRFGQSVLSITRSVSLMGRTVRSVTRISNDGQGFVPVNWYPHPFFPHPPDNQLCRFSVPISMANTDMFALGADQSIHRVGWPWNGGGFTPIEHDARDHVSVIQRHPLLGSVTVVLGYVPSYTMIYGNSACFSFEPYFERTLGPGQSAEWFVDYLF